ncbi:hypothetical protein N7539_008447 [Penicillium diatomitis]|uniref:SRR1-like domain-containing protein n=1 Tax=Penicillium diatomitis TaxID=2819901 RepID=A0A9W9WU57_9EURO|nr:uncharacterized protein N7539_008447 [Penicillium diatomitis]KAJ5475381.1 hypothetical protein N7539_008447 [Penicillium diatomitis]
MKQNHGSWKKEMDVEEVTSRVIQHAMALTTAGICKGDRSVQLHTQDPDYSKATRKLLTRKGFKVVGIHGAEEFVEIDEETIVISPFTAAPIKQIIADLGCPVLILCTGPGTFNSKAKPVADPESPRTKQMWLDYNVHSISTHARDSDIRYTLKGLQVYSRHR